jgi:hypothetical protein
MTAIAIERETNSYWSLVKNASSEIKLALIARLSNALVTETQQKRTKAASLIADIQANAPVNIPITDEEIQEEINAVRQGQ